VIKLKDHKQGKCKNGSIYIMTLFECF